MKSSVMMGEKSEFQTQKSMSAPSIGAMLKREGQVAVLKEMCIVMSSILSALGVGSSVFSEEKGSEACYISPAI